MQTLKTSRRGSARLPRRRKGVFGRVRRREGWARACGSARADPEQLPPPFHHLFPLSVFRSFHNARSPLASRAVTSTTSAAADWAERVRESGCRVSLSSYSGNRASNLGKGLGAELRSVTRVPPPSLKPPSPFLPRRIWQLPFFLPRVLRARELDVLPSTFLTISLLSSAPTPRHSHTPQQTGKRMALLNNQSAYPSPPH